MVQNGNIILKTFPQVEAQRERLEEMLSPLPNGSRGNAHAAIDDLIQTAMFAGYTQGATDALTPNGAELLSRIVDGTTDPKRLS